MWPDLASPFVIAHRGDKAYTPENTLSSFNQAAEKGADAVEFDVKLSADGQVIVLHDQTVDRTTNGKGNAAKLPLEMLRELEAGVQFPGQFNGERIPTLDEVFETIGKRIYMNVELTNYSTSNDELVPKVVELVIKHGLQSRVLFSSFLARNLQKTRLLLPKVPRALLTLPGLMGLWGRTIGWRGDYAALNPFLMDLNTGLVDRVHSAGKRIIVWTVTAEVDINRMISLGVDGIITDDPALVLRLLGRAKETQRRP
jgi:glycerophosphoryl diester phosphodiesterase